jgi:hypothetical protein
LGALVLGIVLIIGYHYQTHHPIRRLELVRSSGYHIYFKAGFSGFVLLCLSVGIWLVIDFFDIPSSILEKNNFDKSLTFLKKPELWIDAKAAVIFFNMFILSFCYVKVRKIYYFIRKNRHLVRIDAVAHELEKLVISATRQVTPIRIELECGKVYVGIPETPNLEKGEVKYITLLPLLSGYLDDKKKIIFTNNYYRHYERNHSDLDEMSENSNHADIQNFSKDIADFSIVIPVEGIVVSSRFSIEAFIAFREDKGSELIGPPKPQ